MLQEQGIETIINCSNEDVDNFFPEDFKSVSQPCFAFVLLESNHTMATLPTELTQITLLPFCNATRYVEFHIENDHTAEASEHFETAFNALKQVKEDKSCALVHCTDMKWSVGLMMRAHHITCGS